MAGVNGAPGTQGVDVTNRLPQRSGTSGRLLVRYSSLMGRAYRMGWDKDGPRLRENHTFSACAILIRRRNIE